MSLVERLSHDQHLEKDEAIQKYKGEIEEQKWDLKKARMT